MHNTLQKHLIILLDITDHHIGPIPFYADILCRITPQIPQEVFIDQ
jgi:hypothetical protein